MAEKVKAPPVNVFVYGTLKRGHKLHEWMNGSEFVSYDLLYGHTLLDLGPYPALVKVASLTHEFKTQGEVYAMPADYFKELKDMEEKVGYQTVDIVTKNGHRAKAFIFADLANGVASWVLGPGRQKPRVEVKLDDDIPF